MKSSEWTATTGAALPEVVAILNPNPPKYTAGSLANACIDTFSQVLTVSVDQNTATVSVLDDGTAIAVFMPITPPAGGGSLPFE